MATTKTDKGWTNPLCPGKTYPSRNAARKAGWEVREATGGENVESERLGTLVPSCGNPPIPVAAEKPTSKLTLTVGLDGSSTINYVADGKVQTINDEHPNYALILAAIVEKRDPTPLFSRIGGLERDERVEVGAEEVTFNGTKVDDRFWAVVARWTQEGKPMEALLNFLTRLDLNPSERSKKELFDWVERGKLVINDEGFFLGFKSVDQNLRSHSTGTACVDGVKHTGKIPNHLGAVVTMPRDEVDGNPYKACSGGLHVGTYSYAKTYTSHSVVMEVKVDPADVVSVPLHDTSKLRCCRYEVVKIHGSYVTKRDLTVPAPVVTEAIVDDFVDDEAAVQGFIIAPEAEVVFEPEGNPVDVEAIDAVIATVVPAGFFGRLRHRIGRKG